MGKLSVVVSAFNEEKKIQACLESIEWADEIILIDSSSTDKTSQIGGEYTSKVYVRPNNLMLNINKNFGFSKATGDWILSLDADERVTPELRKEILSAIGHMPSAVNGYWIPRKNIIFGKWIRSEMWWPDYQLRLFQKGKGAFPQKHVHEKVEVNGETDRLKSPMLHENYSSVSQFLYKMDKIYTENEAKNILEDGKTLSWVGAIRMPANDFMKTFFAQKGYKDGLHGLVLSILQAMYMEVVFAKVWEEQGFREVNNASFFENVTEELQKIGKEIKYWILTRRIKEGKNTAKNFFLKIRRKFI